MYITTRVVTFNNYTGVVPDIIILGKSETCSHMEMHLANIILKQTSKDTFTMIKNNSDNFS